MSRLNKANLSNKNYFGFYFFGFAYYFGKPFVVVLVSRESF